MRCSKLVILFIMLDVYVSFVYVLLYYEGFIFFLFCFNKLGLFSGLCFIEVGCLVGWESVFKMYEVLGLGRVWRKFYFSFIIGFFCLFLEVKRVMFLVIFKFSEDLGVSFSSFLYLLSIFCVSCVDLDCGWYSSEYVI